jgi:hypothetical protein
MDTVVFLAIFLGCAGRAFIPYLKKMRAANQKGAQIEDFDWRFGISALASLLIAAIAAVLASASFDVPDQDVFVAGFVYGWGQTDLFNRLVS